MKIRKDTKEKIINSGKYPDITIGEYHYHYDLVNNGNKAVIVKTHAKYKNICGVVAHYDNDNNIVWREG